MDGVGSPDGLADTSSMLDMRYPTSAPFAQKYAAAAAAASGYDGLHATAGRPEAYAAAAAATHFSCSVSPHPLYTSGFGLTNLVKSEIWPPSAGGQQHCYSPSYEITSAPE